MTAVIKLARKKTNKDAPDGARRCLATGEMKLRAELIRFVIGPDKSVVADLSENLPGHGLWVSASRDAIELAIKKNLFAKAAKEQAHPAADLVDSVAALLRKRCLTFFGLAKGAGIAVLGESQTEAALRARKLALFLHAPDATRTLDNRSGVCDCALFSRDEMGAAFGYDQIVYAGLAPHGLTEKLKLELNRLQLMIPVGKNEG